MKYGPPTIDWPSIPKAFMIILANSVGGVNEDPKVDSDDEVLL